MELSPSEKICAEEIKERIEQIGRKILFVSGEIGTGKTTVAKFLAKNLDGQYLSFIFDFDSFVMRRENIKLSKILKRLDDNLNCKVVFIDDIDPLLFELKLQNLFVSEMISIYRNVYSNKYVFFSSNISRLISEEDQLKSIITKDNIIYLGFNDKDNYFLYNNIRKKNVHEPNYNNFYGV